MPHEGGDQRFRWREERLIRRAVRGKVATYRSENGEVADINDGEGDSVGYQIYRNLMNGVSSMLPILAGFIAMSIADRPGFAVGFVGGAIAANGTSGFLGALIAGFVAGYTVQLRFIWHLTAL